MAKEFKIIVSETTTRVYFDGKELNGIMSLKFEQDSESLPTAIIEFNLGILTHEFKEAKKDN